MPIANPIPLPGAILGVAPSSYIACLRAYAMRMPISLPRRFTEYEITP